MVGLKLNSGNANPANIGADFARFGIRFWDHFQQRDTRNQLRQQRLEELNRWRNAIAHQDFSSPFFAGRDTLRISQVRAWRSVCACLAVEFDRVMKVGIDHRGEPMVIGTRAESRCKEAT